MKKSLTIVLTLVMVLTLLAGCGGSSGGVSSVAPAGSESTAAPADAADASGAEPIGVSEYTGQDIYEINGGESFSIRMSMPNGTALNSWFLFEEAKAAFEKDYPNVQVILDGSGDTATWRQNAIVEFAGSDAPAVSWCVPAYANSFMADGLIIDWRDVYANPRHAYFSEYLSEATRENMADSEGRIVYLPFEGNIGSMYYNKGIFEEHGWEPPTTFEGLLTLCDEMNAAGVVPFVTGGGDFRYAWLITQMMISTAGVDNTRALATGAFDQWANPDYGFPQTLEAMQQLIDHKFFHPGVNGVSQQVDEPAMFVNGEAAMSYEGFWKTNYYISAGSREWVDKNLGVFPFPVISENGNADAIIGGTANGYVISTKQNDYQIEASIEFCKYLVSQKFMTQYIELGTGMPAGKIEYNESVVPATINQLYDDYLAAEKTVFPMDGLASDPLIDMTLKKEVIPMMIAGQLNTQTGVEYMDKIAKTLVK